MIRVGDRLIRVSEWSDMDSKHVTIDQLTTAMASIQEAITSLSQVIDA